MIDRLIFNSRWAIIKSILMKTGVLVVFTSIIGYYLDNYQTGFFIALVAMQLKWYADKIMDIINMRRLFTSLNIRVCDQDELIETLSKNNEEDKL